jgi:hypothetical protein
MTKRELLISVVVGIVIGIIILFHSRQQIAPIDYLPSRQIKPIVNPPSRLIPPIVYSPPGEFEPISCCPRGQALLNPMSCSVSAQTSTFVSGGEKINRRIAVITYILFDHQISNDDKRASTRLLLPKFDKIDSAKLEITAYNDDPRYERTIWFEIDGQGGNIGDISSRGFSFCGWEIEPKETKTWNYDLQLVKLATTRRMGETKEVNLLDVLRKSGIHTISSYVTTYENYGPKSWVSIKLIITITEEKKAPL